MTDEATSWLVSQAEAGNRLDRHVAERLDRPRNQVRRWIEKQHITLDGEAVKPSSPVTPGCRVSFSPPPPPATDTLVPESGELTVVFEDQDLVVVDKPAGIAVHPGAGRARGTLVHRVLARYPEISAVGGSGRPGIVHRIDLDTTGLLLIARSELAYRELTAAFAERRIEKTYQALAFGTFRQTEGSIELPIGRHRGDRKKMAIVPRGRPAVSRYRCLRSVAGISRVELDILTGRTHQIRVHLKAIGHPLVGDPVYGEARWRGMPRERQRPLSTFARTALHAWRLRLKHPRDGSRLELEAPIPEDLRTLWTEVTGEPWDD